VVILYNKESENGMIDKTMRIINIGIYLINHLLRVLLGFLIFLIYFPVLVLLVLSGSSTKRVSTGRLLDRMIYLTLLPLTVR